MPTLRRQLAWIVSLLALTALAAPAARAQTGKIAGLVTDVTSGAPIEGVQVAVQGTGYGDVTRSNGRYTIIGVPPGTYTVIARRIGYQSTEVSGVNVSIDVTRPLDIKLNAASTTLAAQRIVAEAVPLVEHGVTGSQTTITAEQIQSLPVTNINGVLALQQGFIELPQNTQLQSLSEESRSTVQPIRVRGGRGGATVTLIDGMPVNNPIFGTQAISLNQLAASGVDFVRGYMEPQYGNGLSGVINQATREGGTDVAGQVEYSSSQLAGAFGSDPDRLNAANNFRGFLSGPVPGTSTKIRYAVSGEMNSSAGRILQFDNDVNSYNRPVRFPNQSPTSLDLQPGWRAFGGNRSRQIVGKLTFLPTTTTKINALAIDQERQSVGYDRRYYLQYTGDPLALVNNIADSLGLAGSRNNRDITQSSVRDKSRLYGATLEQRFGRAILTIRGSQSDFERNTCNIFLGSCVPQPFVQGQFSERFFTFFGGLPTPYGASGLVYGGETYTTRSIKADIQSQASDHHNVRVGAQFLKHDIVYDQLSGPAHQQSGVLGSIPFVYRAKPTEAAAFIQDWIEYDFLTLRLGVRYDYGKAQGRGFRDPLNPTGGTTAREVCDGTAPSVGATTPITFLTKTSGGADTTLTGTAACLASPPATPGGRPALLEAASKTAQVDDFKEADPRKAFSPRVGVSFPLSERSTVFFNAGRYTMNPLYGNLYQNSGVGVQAGVKYLASGTVCEANQVKPGTNECVPPLQASTPGFIGNPNLLLEQATQYEVGYASQFSRIYAINFVVFNRDESGLSGVRTSDPVQDIGTTYAGQSLPKYNTIVNQDFLTARGIEVQFRRTTSNRWNYDINYGWSRTTTNAPPPDVAEELIEDGGQSRTKLIETLADIDQPHRLNVSLGYVVRNDVPKIPFGSLLRRTSASLTYQMQSGLPYTPVDALQESQVTSSIRTADVNTGRGPATINVGLLVRKDWAIGNMNYGGTLRVSNLFNRKNCQQVYVNTGNCDAGLRDVALRRVGNGGESTSSDADQPEYIGQPRLISAGISIRF